MGMSDYVRALRAKIGHDFVLMPAVGALIRNDAGRVLLVQHVEGRWQIPGGAIDPGERPADALRRECMEEAGVEIRVGRILGAFGGPEHRITYANGDEVGWVTSIFEAELVAGQPHPDHDETQAVGWFAPDEVDALDMHPATRATLRAALRAP